MLTQGSKTPTKILINDSTANRLNIVKITFYAYVKEKHNSLIDSIDQFKGITFSSIFSQHLKIK